MKKITLELAGNEIYNIKWIITDKIKEFEDMEKGLGSIEWDEHDWNDYHDTMRDLNTILDKVKKAQP